MGTPAPSVLLLVLWDPSRAAAGVAAPAARRWRWRDERRWKEGRRWLKRHYDGRGGERVFGCCGDCLTCGAKPAAVSSPTGGRAPHAPARYMKGGESLPVEREKVRVSSQADTGVPERRRLRARLSRCAPVGVVVGARSDARRLGGLVPNRQWDGGGGKLVAPGACHRRTVRQRPPWSPPPPLRRWGALGHGHPAWLCRGGWGSLSLSRCPRHSRVFPPPPPTTTYPRRRGGPTGLAAAQRWVACPWGRYSLQYQSTPTCSSLTDATVDATADVDALFCAWSARARQARACGVGITGGGVCRCSRSRCCWEGGGGARCSVQTGAKCRLSTTRYITKGGVTPLFFAPRRSRRACK